MMTKVKACRAVNIIITAIFVVALFLFLLSFAVSLPILNRWFYFIQIGPLRLEQATGHTYDEIKEAYNEIMDYLLLPRREFGAGVFEFSESGAAHFADCKPLFVLDVALAGTCGAVTAVIAALHFAKVVQIGRLAGLSAAFWTALAAIAVPLVLACLIIPDFGRAFEIFHAVLFPGKDNWIFDSATDPIIDALPQQFWINCAVFIGAGLAVMCAATMAGSATAARMRKNRAAAAGQG